MNLAPQSASPDTLNPAPSPFGALPNPDFLKLGSPPNGKIAKLPPELRTLLNQMLSEGATGAVIIAEFARRGISLNHENISNWRNGGHRDWLIEQHWLAEMAAEHESVGHFLVGGDDTAFQQGAIQLAILQIFQRLKKGNLADDPANYTRLLNSLARLAREALVLKKYRDQCAKELPQSSDPDRPLTDNDHERFYKKVQELFSLKRRPTPAVPPPLTLNPQPPTSPAPQEQTPKINPGESAVETPIPNIPAEATPPAAPSSPIENPLPSTPIENLKSKIENAVQNALPGPELTPLAIENQKSKIENPAGEPPIPNSPREATPPTPIENQRPKIENPPNTTVQNALPGPELAPPSIEIQKSKIENARHCQFCHTRARPLQPRPWCRICGKPLPPPGQRFVTRCAACGSSVINVTNTGQRLYERCPRCQAPLPFLEPRPAVGNRKSKI